MPRILRKGFVRRGEFLDAMFGLCRDKNKLDLFFPSKRRLLTKDIDNIYIFLMFTINLFYALIHYNLLTKTIIYITIIYSLR